MNNNFLKEHKLRGAVRAGLLLVAGAMACVPGTLVAQETTSDIRGVVTDANGDPLADANVTLRNEATGLTRSVTTNDAGEFALRNLPIGNRYTVQATHSGYAGESVEDMAVTLGQTASLRFDLESASENTSIDEILVVGSAETMQQIAMGPNASFDLNDLQRTPAINRNITDIIRVDPRIYIDESRGDLNSVQCGGKNSRFNSLTVDGVRMNDAFGLNSNGYPTERMPFSYDAINQVSVELAPFDVEYGGFTACNINAVTKSGSNEFSGGTFWDYTNDGFRGDSLEGDPITTGDYSENRFGFNLGGPLIEDRLFFFLAYEKLEGANLFDRGPIGSGAVNEIDISQEELDEILDIARTVYQYDPGQIPNSRDNEDEKLLLKLDWAITDNHRASFTYNYNDGFNIAQSDGGLSEFEFSNHLYERGAKLNSFALNVYSAWTDSFSTEIRLGRLELDNRQIPLGGTDFGEIRVETDQVDVYLGADDSRHANVLSYETDTLALKGYYYLDNGHELTFGYEREAFDVYNLFVQHSETEIRFDGIDNFRNGFASAIYYNNAPTSNPADAAADWGYEINTIYLQDEFGLGSRLNLVAGLRYDRYSTGDEPPVNPDFLEDYGFPNSATLDGEDLLQPRLGFNYDLSEAMRLRGGVGLYSGGNPNVWLSNTYSANNVQQFGQRGGSFGYTDAENPRSLFDDDVVYRGLEDGVPNGPGWGVPSELYEAVEEGTGDNFEINYLDPDFDLPSEWKYALGMTWFLPDQYTLNADFLYTRGDNTAMVLRGDIEQTGTNPDGYPVYESVREPSFVLTNSDEGNESLGLSLSVTKEYDNGVDWVLGYAYSDAEDVQPMTSSVAFSNYTNRAFFDPQEDVLSTSNYNIEHRFTGVLNWQTSFFGNNMTYVSLYGSVNQGPSYSYTFNGTADPYNFTPYLDNQPIVLEPGAERNSEGGSWWGKLDFRVEQEFGGFTPNSKASAFLVIDNLTNLLNDEWGIMRQVDFPNTVEIGSTASEERRVGDASRYEIRLGLRYDF